MILFGLLGSGSESRCLSDGCLQYGDGAGGCGSDEVVSPTAGVLAAQGDDVGGVFDGPCMPDCLARWTGRVLQAASMAPNRCTCPGRGSGRSACGPPRARSTPASCPP